MRLELSFWYLYWIQLFIVVVYPHYFRMYGPMNQTIHKSYGCHQMFRFVCVLLIMFCYIFDYSIINLPLLCYAIRLMLSHNSIFDIFDKSTNKISHKWNAHLYIGILYNFYSSKNILSFFNNESIQYLIIKSNIGQ